MIPRAWAAIAGPLLRRPDGRAIRYRGARARQVSSGLARQVRVESVLTGKMVAEIGDPAAFEQMPMVVRGSRSLRRRP